MDLDHTPPASPAATDSDPAIVSEEGLAGVWVDDQRLYWLTAFGTFQSCRKADCEHTKLIYVKGDHEQPVAAAVANGHVYWTRELSFVYSCAVEGCEPGPVMMVQDPGQRAGIQAHQDYVYWSSDADIYRCPASGCGVTPEVVASDVITGSLAFDETRVYWMAEAGVMSAPLDGSERPELVFDWDQFHDPQYLVVEDGYLYWTLSTQLFRCPLATCSSSAPTLLTTSDNVIYDLKVDASAMYWREGEGVARAIHSCPREGCEQSSALTPPQITPNNLGMNEAAAFALDATDLYWIEVGEPSEDTAAFGKSIRKTAK